MSIKLYATGSATANAVASILIPSTSTIVQVQYALRINSITDGAQVDLELSRASARQTQTNEALDSIAVLCIEGNFVTSGLSQTGLVGFIPMRERFTQGQRLYLHALITGTVVYDATFLVHFG